MVGVKLYLIWYLYYNRFEFSVNGWIGYNSFKLWLMPEIEISRYNLCELKYSEQYVVQIKSVA